MAVEVIICYAHKDERFLHKLKIQLKPLLREGLVNLWHDRDISAGKEWKHEIDEHLNTAQIILLLVSPDFIGSDRWGDKREISTAENTLNALTGRWYGSDEVGKFKKKARNIT